jgi:hypothetical protein
MKGKGEIKGGQEEIKAGLEKLKPQREAAGKLEATINSVRFELENTTQREHRRSKLGLKTSLHTRISSFRAGIAGKKKNLQE